MPILPLYGHIVAGWATTWPGPSDAEPTQDLKNVSMPVIYNRFKSNYVKLF